jgi:hypothetical protein
MSAESVAAWVLACCTRPRIELGLSPVRAVLGGRAVAVAESLPGGILLAVGAFEMLRKAGVFWCWSLRHETDRVLGTPREWMRDS